MHQLSNGSQHVEKLEKKISSNFFGPSFRNRPIIPRLYQAKKTLKFIIKSKAFPISPFAPKQRFRSIYTRASGIPHLSLKKLTPDNVHQAFCTFGGFILETDCDHASMFSSAKDFFRSMSRQDKLKIAIERSSNFRGWSEMQNERDWREQLHFGRHNLSHKPSLHNPDYVKLEGPNLWSQSKPSSIESSLRDHVDAHLSRTCAIGVSILNQLGLLFDFQSDHFSSLIDTSYLVMKLIAYHPQRGPDIRMGVAPHVDFSYITLNAQDTPGLEALGRSDGLYFEFPHSLLLNSPLIQFHSSRLNEYFFLLCKFVGNLKKKKKKSFFIAKWHKIPKIPGAFWVHPGELLQVEACFVI